MRSTFKTVFYVNGSKERNGIVPIMGRVTINGTIAQFSCKLSVTKAIWDAKGNRAKGRSKEANEVNFALLAAQPWRKPDARSMDKPYSSFIGISLKAVPFLYAISIFLKTFARQ